MTMPGCPAAAGRERERESTLFVADCTIMYDGIPRTTVVRDRIAAAANTPGYITQQE